MKKWEKIENAFQNATDIRALAEKLDNRTTFIFVDGPASDTFNQHAFGADNRRYSQTMVEGWNRRNGTVVGSRKMRLFV